MTPTSWDQLRTARGWLEAGRIPRADAIWVGRNGVTRTDRQWDDPIFGHLSPGGWFGACPWRCAEGDTTADPDRARKILADAEKPQQTDREETAMNREERAINERIRAKKEIIRTEALKAGVDEAIIEDFFKMVEGLDNLDIDSAIEQLILRQNRPKP